MSAVSSQSPSTLAGSNAATPVPVSPAQIDASCRLPLVVLFLGAAVWLLLGSVLALVSSIKFHAPAFLGDSTWLTYGRVRPAGVNCMLYGFGIQAGLGIALWILARLGRTMLAGPALISFGAGCWNLGMMIGVMGILAGGSTGFESLEMPRYAAGLLLLGYLMIAVQAMVTFHRRREAQTYVSQYFLVAALFWFPWIYSTAALVLFDFGARGMAQAVVAWWYANNLRVVWLGLVGLAGVFYLVPKLTQRDLHSRHHALLAFWMLILFGSWGGIPATAPVPAWMPVASAAATLLNLVTYLAVTVNLHRTLEGHWSRLWADPSLRFIGFGVGAFLLTGLLRTVTVPPEVSRVTQFTWFTPALGMLNSYGFFTMVVLGAAYYVVPKVMGRDFPFPKLVRAHFWAVAAGVLLLVAPLAVGGIIQGLKLQQADIAFNDVTKSTLHFLRVSTMGDLLLAFGHLLFLLNLSALAVGFYRARVSAAWVDVTTELVPAEARQ